MDHSRKASSSSKQQKTISSFFAKASPSAQKARPTVCSEISKVSSEEVEPSRLDARSPTTLGADAAPKRTLQAAQESLDDDTNSSGLPNRKRARTSKEPHDSKSTETVIPAATRKSTSPDHPSHPITANEIKHPKASARTSKYVFSSSLPSNSDPEDDDAARRHKEKLHRDFVKKLGKPDSLHKFRLNSDSRENAVGGEDEEDRESHDDEAQAAPGIKSKASGKGGSKQTPLEKQVIDIKTKHPDTVLVVEVGYKFRFFGEDARTAAKELSIVCIPGKFLFDSHPSESHLDRFASASIPVHRLHVHVKRLVSAGHKVGIVRQLETAALKAAGDNRNAPFERKLTNLYTKGTYIDDVDGLDGPADDSLRRVSTAGYILCMAESKAKAWGTDEKVHVGIVAVQPATGDVIYDDFEDGFMRTEIETRLLHIAPCEFLIVGPLSKSTERLVRHLSETKSNVFRDKLRVERIERPSTMTAHAYNHVSNFYAAQMKASNSATDPERSSLLDKVLRLSEDVTICLSALITHLSDYGLEHVFDLTKYFQSFSARSHMLLNGTSLTSLEIYQNQTDHSPRGSLFWTLDRTKTKFGQRLLRKWVGRPLLDRAKLELRIAAVEELKNSKGKALADKLVNLLASVKIDLEKSLIRIYYGKCTRPELLSVLVTTQRVATEFSNVNIAAEGGFWSSMIREAIAALPTMLDDAVRFLEKINPVAAKEDDKYAFFREAEETASIEEHKLGIASVEHDLDEHRAVAAEKLKKRKIDYVTSSGIEYLIEIENAQLKNVPASWVKISGTKKLSRFHTPEVVQLVRERDQHKESLAAACDAAFVAFLREISNCYQSFRDCVQALATLDCLSALAEVAAQPGYVKPEYSDETSIVIEKGRHPMVEQLLLGGFVPNDVALQSDGARALLVTGPNMGGKSSYVRQIALISIMGQVGSYVPAHKARLGLLDAIFTRMGAFDNMMAGESTFMIELSETSDILKQATSRSLVILDELGRGTSTHDGVAIAQAVLDYVVREIQCLTLFITHYQNLSSMARAFENSALQNVHMRFTEGGKEGQDVTFLYDVGAGVAHRSYGYASSCSTRSASLIA